MGDLNQNDEHECNKIRGMNSMASDRVVGKARQKKPIHEQRRSNCSIIAAATKMTIVAAMPMPTHPSR
jgi:hypothetical protein